MYGMKNSQISLVILCGAWDGGHKVLMSNGHTNLSEIIHGAEFMAVAINFQ